MSGKPPFSLLHYYTTTLLYFSTFLRRPPHSHKGQNGTVAIIGGSRFQHGAPLFSALAAEASGVDLIFVALPRCHAEVAKAQSLNMQVHPFTGDDIAACDLPMLLELLATMDCAVIGPGLARDPTAVGVIKRLIKGCPCPMVLDASALQPWTLDACAGKAVLCTPHAGELERMKIGEEDIGNAAKRHGALLLAKGSVDRIAGTDGIIHEVKGGNAGLTVGGTGDALAGLAAGLIAQGMEMTTAAITASTVIKRAGDKLQKDYGYAYGTRRVIDVIPLFLHSQIHRR